MSYTSKTVQMPPTSECPKDTYNKSTAEILDIIRARFCVPEAGDKPNKTYKYLVAVSKAVFDEAYWKNPVKVANAIELKQFERNWIEAVIIWYHGADPISTPAAIYSPGYACY